MVSRACGEAFECLLFGLLAVAFSGSVPLVCAASFVVCVLYLCGSAAEGAGGRRGYEKRSTLHRDRWEREEREKETDGVSETEEQRG